MALQLRKHSNILAICYPPNKKNCKLSNLDLNIFIRLTEYIIMYIKITVNKAKHIAIYIVRSA